MARKNGPIRAPPESPHGFAHTTTFYSNNSKGLANIRVIKNRSSGVVHPILSKTSEISPISESSDNSLHSVNMRTHGVSDSEDEKTSVTSTTMILPSLDGSESEKISSERSSYNKTSDIMMENIITTAECEVSVSSRETEILVNDTSRFLEYPNLTQDEYDSDDTSNEEDMEVSSISGEATNNKIDHTDGCGRHDIKSVSPLPNPCKLGESGYALARISRYNQVSKLWRAIYWIRYGTSCVLIFRSKSDFDKWFSNTSYTEKKRASIVLQKIDFINDLSKRGIMGFRISKLKSKTNKRSSSQTYKFKVECGTISGVRTVVAFSSPSTKEIESLRRSMEQCLCNISDKG